MGQYPTKAGIYKLTCLITGKIYIGKSINIRKRMSNYKHCEKRTKGRSYLENAIIKYKWESFIVDILEIFEDFNKSKDNELLLIKESEYISLFDSTNQDIGYNICKFSNDGTGIPKKPISDEHREKLRQARRHQIRGPVSEETKEKIRQANIGKIVSEETKLKLRQKTLSDEHKEALTNSKLGKSRSEETKEKIRQGHLGKTHSDETKEKMRKAKEGRSLSEEHKEKIRLTKKKKDVNI